MKKTLTLFSLAIAAVVALGVFVLPHVARADNTAYTCTTAGKFASSNVGPAALTTTDNTNVAAATAWLKTMMGTATQTVTNSTITPTTDYASSYQGAMTGTFDLQGRSFASSASIVIDSPQPLDDSYRGVVTGHILDTPEQWRWIIQAYKRDNGVISQVPVQALADGTTGAFSIDVSGVSAGTPGEWMFGILDANASYAEYGSKWPDATYVGLEVQQFIVTDTEYYWATAPANTDGTFAFINSNTGSKMFRLVDTTTNPDDILAEYVKPTGLLRSYLYEPGETGYGTAMEDRSFVYDQAIALFSAIGQHDDAFAKQLVDGLLYLQTTSGQHAGGFVFTAPQLSPTYTDMIYRTGAHAIATDALLAYMEAYPTDGDIATYQTAAESALDFLTSTHAASGVTQGLYLGGYGLYSGMPQTFDPTYSIQWASTEHNIDTWHALTRASHVLGNASVDYSAAAGSLSLAIISKLYDASEHRLNQGYTPTGPDTADPLDVNSWGAIQLYATGNVSQAQAAIARLSLFDQQKLGIDGYGPFYDSAGYPGTTDTVWFEGSFGAALAQYKLGNYSEYRRLINELGAGQESDGSFRYATDADTTYEIGISKSVASTAWFVVATSGRDSIWNSCSYLPPAATDTPAPTVTPAKTATSPSITSEDTLAVVPDPVLSQNDEQDTPNNYEEEAPIGKKPNTTDIPRILLGIGIPFAVVTIVAISIATYRRNR